MINLEAYSFLCDGRIVPRRLLFIKKSATLEGEEMGLSLERMDVMLDDNEIDDEGRLHLAIVPTNQPCVSCGTPGSNLQWKLGGRVGVLCRRCLSAFVEDLNQSLGANDPVSGGYQATEGDLYVQEIRPGWFNVHRYQGDAWEYVTVLQKPEADQLIAGLHLVGERKAHPGPASLLPRDHRSSAKEYPHDGRCMTSLPRQGLCFPTSC